MKKTIIIFVICALVLCTTLVWAFNAELSGNITEVLMIAGVFIVVGFAVFVGIERAKSVARKEPQEDELSRKVMMKTSSLSYYISLYLWLFLMYISDRIDLETHTQIGTGILGMAIIFFLSWLWAKFVWSKNG